MIRRLAYQRKNRSRKDKNVEPPPASLLAHPACAAGAGARQGRHGPIRTIVYLGRIVEMAPARELYERSLHPYTRLLMRIGAGFQNPRTRGRADQGASGRGLSANGCRHERVSLRAALSRDAEFPRCSEQVPELQMKEPRHFAVVPFGRQDPERVAEPTCSPESAGTGDNRIAPILHLGRPLLEMRASARLPTRPRRSDRLAAEVQRMLGEPAMVDRLKSLYFVPAGESLGQYARIASPARSSGGARSSRPPA